MVLGCDELHRAHARQLLVRIAAEGLDRGVHERQVGFEIEDHDRVVRALDDGPIALLAGPQGRFGVRARSRHGDHLAREPDERGVVGLGLAGLGCAGGPDPPRHLLGGHAVERRQGLDGEAGRFVGVAGQEATGDPHEQLVALGAPLQAGLRGLSLGDVLDDRLHDALAALEFEGRDAYVGDEGGAVEPERHPFAALGAVLDGARHVLPKGLARGPAVGLRGGRQVGDLRPAELLDACGPIDAQRGLVAVDEALVLQRSEGDGRGRALEERAIEALGIGERAGRALARLQPFLQIGDDRCCVVRTHAHTG